MFLLRTRDDWTEATATIGVGSSSALFTPSDAVTSGHHYAGELAAFFLSEFGVSATVTFQRDAATAGLLVKISAGSSFTYIPSAQALLMIGISPVVTPSASVVGSFEISGSWGPKHYNFTMYRSNPAFSGIGSGSGTIGSSGDGKKPRFTALCTPLEVAQLAMILHTSGTPAIGYMFEIVSSSWRRVTVGEFTRTKRGPLTYAINAELLG